MEGIGDNQERYDIGGVSNVDSHAPSSGEPTDALAGAIAKTLSDLFEAIESGSLKATQAMLDHMEKMTEKYNELIGLLNAITKDESKSTEEIADRIQVLVTELRQDIAVIKEPGEEEGVAGLDNAGEIKKTLTEQLDAVELLLTNPAESLLGDIKDDLEKLNTWFQIFANAKKYDGGTGFAFVDMMLSWTKSQDEWAMKLTIADYLKACLGEGYFPEDQKDDFGSPSDFRDLLVRLAGYGGTLEKMTGYLGELSPEVGEAFGAVRSTYNKMWSKLSDIDYMQDDPSTIGGFISYLSEGFEPTYVNLRDIYTSEKGVTEWMAFIMADLRVDDMGGFTGGVNGNRAEDALGAIDNLNGIMTGADSLSLIRMIGLKEASSRSGDQAQASVMKELFAQQWKSFQNAFSAVQSSTTQVGSMRTEFVTQAEGSMKRFQSLLGEFETLLREVQMRSDVVLRNLKR